MRKLGLMIQFFTRIPLPVDCHYSEENFKKALACFPLVGLIIGLLLGGLAYVLPYSFIRGVLVTIGYLALSGGLHLDGFADTYDGVYSGRDQARKLEIMKDPNVGSFGAIALIMIIITYVIGFSDIYWLSLVLLMVASRAIAQSATHGQVYARKDGMGKWFIESSPTLLAMFIVLLTLVFSQVYHLPQMMVAILVMIVWVNIRRAHVVKQLGGLTGDVIGFFIEESQMIGLITLLLMELW